ncbi:MAG: hypothetical protein M3Y34_09615 [Actinomycetota bacterium]|nr:hypothetical protein [Actinomycetota bacterium]
MKSIVALSALFLAAVMVSGCVLALPTYNDPFSEKVLVMAPEPSRFEVQIEGSGEGFPVPEDGRLVLEFPVLPRECSTYLFGVKIKDRSVEGRDLVHFVRDGRVVKKLSVKQLRRRPLDDLGYHKVRLR